MRALLCLALASCAVAVDSPHAPEATPDPVATPQAADLALNGFPVGDWLLCGKKPDCQSVAFGMRFHPDGTYERIGPEFNYRPPTEPYCLRHPESKRGKVTWRRTAPDSVLLGQGSSATPFTLNEGERAVRTYSASSKAFFLKVDPHRAIETCLRHGDACTLAGECASGACEDGKCFFSPTFEMPGM